jgi:hypothetical protein
MFLCGKNKEGAENFSPSPFDVFLFITSLLRYFFFISLAGTPRNHARDTAGTSLPQPW